MNHNNCTRLIPVTDWEKYYPWPTRAGLRHLIFSAKSTSSGFDRVVRRVGGRCLIDEAAFFAWADKQAGPQ